jgi:uncharacterized lipoprotein YmbA
MKKRTYPKVCFVWVILAVIAMLAAGCGGASKPSKFYLLHSLPEPEARISTAADKAGLSVLIGPITLPAYLDRTQVVTLSGEHELVFDEFTRWAEPLQDNFYRILVENLSLLLETPEVYAYDRRGSTPADIQIIIDVTRFDTDAEGDAYLTAFWTVTGKDGKAASIRRKSVFHAAAPSPGITGILKAQNRTLTEFSREIAGAVQPFKP